MASKRNEFAPLMEMFLQERGVSGAQELSTKLCEAGWDFDEESVQSYLEDPFEAGLDLEFLWGVRDALGLGKGDPERLGYCYFCGEDIFWKLERMEGRS